VHKRSVLDTVFHWL